DPARSDRVNEAVRLHLLATGQAVVGRTEVAGRTRLELTLMNPTATAAPPAPPARPPPPPPGKALKEAPALPATTAIEIDTGRPGPLPVRHRPARRSAAGHPGPAPPLAPAESRGAVRRDT